MKKLFLCILSTFLLNISHATAVLKKPDDVTVKINFNYKMADNINHTELSDEKNIQTVLTMPTNDHQWILLGGTQGNIRTSIPNDQIKTEHHLFELLSKIAQADAQKITIQFLVKDINAKSKFIRGLKTTAAYGQKKRIHLSEGDREIELTVLAERIITQ